MLHYTILGVYPDSYQKQNETLKYHLEVYICYILHVAVEADMCIRYIDFWNCNLQCQYAYGT